MLVKDRALAFYENYLLFHSTTDLVRSCLFATTYFGVAVFKPFKFGLPRFRNGKYQSISSLGRRSEIRGEETYRLYGAGRDYTEKAF